MTVAADRLEHIDGLRGLASIAVAWFHLTNGYPSDSPVRLSGLYGWTGVEAFFVISGFILPLAMYRAGYEVQYDFGKFMAKRLIRLEPPYLLSIACVIGLAYLSALAPGFRGSHPNYEVVQIASHAGYLTGILGLEWINVVYWTLAIEFQFYLLIALTLPVWVRCQSVVFLCATAAISGLGLLVGADAFVIHYWPLFALGIAVFRLVCGFDTKLWAATTAILCASLLTLEHGVAVALAAVVSAAIIHQAPRFLRSRVLLWVGSISFSLYLLHVPIGGRVVNLMMRMGESELLRIFTSSLALVASVASAWIFWRVVERPATLLAAKIRLGKGQRSSAKRSENSGQPSA